MADLDRESKRPHRRPQGQCSFSCAAMDTKYDVFLNHRGPDVKGGFIAHLEEALRQVGLNPFLDKRSLVKGEGAFGSINAALEVARIHVAVVSRGYADSKYCLSELVAMLRSNKPVIPVFYDVEPWELRQVEKGRFAEAFEKHKSQESAERVQDWADALGALADITGFCFRLSDYQRDEAELKREVVDAVLSSIPRNYALEVGNGMVGMKEHVQTCVRKLSEMICSDTSFLCITGMGGIGKSSLAKEMYNYFAGEDRFQAMSFLKMDHNSMEVGASMVSRLQMQLVWDLLSVPHNNGQGYGYWFQQLASRGPVLIVLDDIRERSEFDEVILNLSKYLAAESCVIVTSRDKHLLKVIAGKRKSYLHEMTPLGCEDSEKLFNIHAFGEEEAPEEFKVLAHDVSKACGGLPLALKVVGSSLYGNTSEEDRECIWPEAVDVLKGDPDVRSALKWSYDCLSEAEKLMFADIACVFCGWKKEEAMKIWQGCKECSSCCGGGSPHTSLRKLVDKCLVVVEDAFKNNVLTMHGLLRDLGQGIGKIDGSHLWDGKASRTVNDKVKETSKVRALNLASSGMQQVDVTDLGNMPNLHFLILDGCIVKGNLGRISKELRHLQWRYIPLTHPPPTLSLSNLVSLDFSCSTKLSATWAESSLTMEACPNLLSLDLSMCTSMTTLPESVGRLSRLQAMNLNNCSSLQRLPSSIGQLTSLKKLLMGVCKSLEALPDSITSLSGLQNLSIELCPSLSKLPAGFGVNMTGLSHFEISPGPTFQDWQALSGLNGLKTLVLKGSTDEGITALDSSGAFRNLPQLYALFLLEYEETSLTKIPQTIELLTNLNSLDLVKCKKLLVLPNFIGQLKALRRLSIRECSSLDTLPETLGSLTSLTILEIVRCTSLTKLPTSVGDLPRLGTLLIQECGELQSLPESIAQLRLCIFQIVDCGSSLEGLSVSKVLRGLKIWGCTSSTELPGSSLLMICGYDYASIYFIRGAFRTERRSLREVAVVEETDCGVLRHVQDTENGRMFLQRVHRENFTCQNVSNSVGSI